MRRAGIGRCVPGMQPRPPMERITGGRLFLFACDTFQALPCMLRVGPQVFGQRQDVSKRHV